MSAFDQAFEIVVGHEGGYTDNPNDRGNWDTGQIGQGKLKGTKYGISAMSYPTIDIAALTLDGAKAIYRRDYWDKIEGDSLDPGLALVVFDAAVNNGVGRAVRWLQEAVGVTADGVIGDATRAAIKAADATEALVGVHAARIHFMASLPTWATFGKGWSRRLAHLPHSAANMEG
jgi:lysozyme family protein